MGRLLLRSLTRSRRSSMRPSTIAWLGLNPRQKCGRRGGQASLGSSWLDFVDKEVSKRRVDLLPDSTKALTALGHEMTHIVIADFFEGEQLPRWADEGMAILADVSKSGGYTSAI